MTCPMCAWIENEDQTSFKFFLSFLRLFGVFFLFIILSIQAYNICCALGLEDRSERTSSHGGQRLEEVSISASMVNYTWIIKKQGKKSS